MVKEMTYKKNRRLMKIIMVCLITVVAFGLFLTWYNVYSTHSQSYKESEKFLNEIAALSLNITDPNSLTLQDFEKVEEIRLRIYHMKTLKPLLKLKNLKRFMFFYIVGSMDLNIDFGPLAQLEKLRELEISPINITFAPTSKKSRWYDVFLAIVHKIKPPAPQTGLFDLGKLRKLKQLESLTIQYNNTCNFEALANLSNLKQLNLRGSYVRDDELEELKKMLPELKIVR
ncbi:MAG: hypothetical protein JW787_07255 [Sedimentisphaerales bacterium]|nr:hypothetical protein [Sedimentisphaerales bacterium]